MPLLIDGYNLLHQSGMIARGIGPGSLERARAALIGFLQHVLSEDERGQTTVVFDAKDAPRGLPAEIECDGIVVMFAVEHAEADDLIEQLIRACSTPGSLTVVSSDHRIQRAARRRRAVAIDSERWVDQRRKARNSKPSPQETPIKPETLSEAEAAFWLAEFGDLDSDSDAPEPDPSRRMDDLDIFPPGYGEDLLDDI